MATDEPTVGQLFAAVSRDLSTLIRSEVELAKAELRDDVNSAAKGGGLFGAAGYLAVLATVLLSFAAVYGLNALGLAAGWSFLIVAGVYLLVGSLLAFIGVRSFKQIKAPERTIKTAQDTAAILKSSDARAQARAEVARG